MASAVPKTPFAVRIETNRILGFRMAQVKQMIDDRVAAAGQSPSYAQIRDELGFNHEKHVSRVVQRLERRGLLTRSGSGRERRIKLVGN
jgi:SOS-response transcriptional repressor LexA